MQPIQSYSIYNTQFDQLFASGAAPYSVTTGTNLYRLVTGCHPHAIEPYRATDAFYRLTYPGASGIHCADHSGLPPAEVLGSPDYSCAPCPSCLIHFEFSGNVLFLDRVPDPYFLGQFLASEGPSRHFYSQCLRHYFDSAGLLTDIHAIAWPSVSGSLLGIFGYACLILPPYSGALTILAVQPLY